MRIERARKQHLKVEAHAIHIGQARLRVGEGHAADRAMLAFAIGAELRQDIARCVGLLRAGTEWVGFERTLDQPAGRVVAEAGCVVNGNRARAAGAIRVR